MTVLRLDKLLAEAGYGTRSEVKKMIRQGLVTVNGSVVKDGAAKVRPADDLVLANGQIVRYRPFVYIMMNKPQGVISATEDAKERTVLDLLPADYRRFRPFPVGRLDKNTEGLLLLTNDGKLAHELLSPRKHVPKTYVAEIDGWLTGEEKAMLARGVQLDDGYVTRPAVVDILAADSGVRKSRVQITITEGKFHQVKRMFLAVGKRVLYLQRTKMGPLSLDQRLAPGAFRELTSEEVGLLTGSEQIVL